MKSTKLGIALVLVTVALTACGGGNETGGDGGSGGSGNEGGSAGGSGGSGGSGNAGGGQACEAQASGTAANHIIIHVSWPESIGIQAGEGDMHVWTMADLTFDGNDVTGTARPCGSLIPALTKTDLAGGGMVQTVIPDEVWDQAGMPSYEVAGTISGFDVGATISMDPIASTVGVTMADPANDPWPAAAGSLTTVDADGDGQPGIKAIPRTDDPFTAPPLDLQGALDPEGDRADEVYIVSRTVVALAGTRDSCASAKGSATVTKVDSHVVGCHIKDGPVCTEAQAKFIDDNQPKFKIESATYEMKQIAAGSTCSDVRAALPAE